MLFVKVFEHCSRSSVTYQLNIFVGFLNVSVKELANRTLLKSKILQRMHLQNNLGSPVWRQSVGSCFIAECYKVCNSISYNFGLKYSLYTLGLYFEEAFSVHYFGNNLKMCGKQETLHGVPYCSAVHTCIYALCLQKYAQRTILGACVSLNYIFKRLA